MVMGVSTCPSVYIVGQKSKSNFPFNDVPVTSSSKAIQKWTFCLTSQLRIFSSRELFVVASIPYMSMEPQYLTGDAHGINAFIDKFDVSLQTSFLPTRKP